MPIHGNSALFGVLRQQLLLLGSQLGISFHVALDDLIARALPRQVPQGSEMIWPVPSQWLQGRLTLKNPCWNRSWPAPLQLGQTFSAAAERAPVPPQS